MFGLNLRRVYCVCDKIMVRTLRNRRFEVAGPNPGLDRRVAAFREEGIPIMDDAEELIEQSESEFHNKLLKYPWKPATQDRIARHDASAMRNWRELKEDTLNIPQDLRQHLLKFSERTIPPLNKESVKPSIMEEKMGEFEKIIRRCAENGNKEPNIETNESTEVALHSPSNNEKKDKRRVTLEEMTATIKNRLESGKAIDLPDQILLSAVNSNNTEISSKKLSKEIDLHETEQPNAVAEYKDRDGKQKSIMEYPERIRIPKKAHKKGATYKVNDCYYDHDGIFLYRVLGMSS
ncbi:hypothetical protein MSG28_012408 [Choristoneura fumiferana]|uniref:Uncharacterized protein n=1 Tax=Choristoneura fumiferana TaxID=7141 RepID=A0ACC0KDM6_CHOFU|nr:hypothetical protein MSG28_012408 [Choristoneura fumiferana]